MAKRHAKQSKYLHSLRISLHSFILIVISYFFLILNDFEYCSNIDSEDKPSTDSNEQYSKMESNENNPHYVTLEKTVSESLVSTISNLLIQKPNKWFVLLPDSVFVRYQQLVDAINDLDNDISVYYSPTANPLLPPDENQHTSILQQAIYLIQASSFINLFSDTPDDSSMNENFLFYFQSNNYRIQQSSLLAVSCLHDQWIFDFLNENDDINFEQYKNYKDTKTYICNQQSKHSNMRAQLHNLSPIVRQDLFSPSHALLAITWVGLLLLILLFFCSRRGYLCFKKYKRSKSKSMKTIGLPKYSNDPLGPIFQPISRKRQPY